MIKSIIMVKKILSLNSLTKIVKDSCETSFLVLIREILQAFSRRIYLEWFQWLILFRGRNYIWSRIYSIYADGSFCRSFCAKLVDNVSVHRFREQRNMHRHNGSSRLKSSFCRVRFSSWWVHLSRFNCQLWSYS